MITHTKPFTLGVIVGNRGFFPAHLCDSGRQTILKVLENAGIRAIALTPEDSHFGTLETLADAHKCADLFKAHRDEIDGILVTLPNFGEERPMANALRWAGLDVPVLIHAFPDDPAKMTSADRRDSFCGKMSVCNNLRQFGIRYSLTAQHTVDPEGPSFAADLARFVSICRVARGMRGLRVGAIGARPAAFVTVRYSEKLLERSGISVETIDLSEIFGRIDRLATSEARVQDKLGAIRDYIPTRQTPLAALERMAKLGVVVDEWMMENELTVSAVQCWTAMEEYFGVVPCTVMSMMSNNLMPSACETDIAGLMGMVAMALASGTPSALVDWNNNYGDDPDKCVLFHCSNLPKDIFADDPIKPEEIMTMDYQEIIAGAVGRDNSYGTVVGRVRAKPFTYCRVSTDDFSGAISAYLGQGELTNDPLATFGGFGVAQIPNLQRLLAHICENGYEHHTAINLSQTADAVEEAFSKYLGWQVYHHR